MFESLPSDVRSVRIPPVVFVGSFPPRECGIATFTDDVVANTDLAFGATSSVAAIDEPEAQGRRYPSRVIARLVQAERPSYRAVARALNASRAELVNVQHEYGLFGGSDGEWFLDFLDELKKPVVVSLHTVLPDPNDHHRSVARRICERSDAVVVLSATGKTILSDAYDVDPVKIHVIHHGVPDVPFRSTELPKAALGFQDRTVISTFGLISRGKGLEFAIDAMATVVREHPEALYLILGQTHPEVRRREGESYRESLQQKIAERGLAENVRLVDRYLGFDELLRFLAASDIYLTPYLNPVQIVSGTLAYAMGCGKAIVSTPYLYAKEVLAHNRGFIADFQDAEAIATVVRALLDDPALRRATERRAYRFGRQMTWPHVAAEYGRLFAELVPRRAAAARTAAWSPA